MVHNVPDCVSRLLEVAHRNSCYRCRLREFSSVFRQTDSQQTGEYRIQIIEMDGLGCREGWFHRVHHHVDV